MGKLADVETSSLHIQKLSASNRLHILIDVIFLFMCFSTDQLSLRRVQTKIATNLVLISSRQEKEIERERENLLLLLTGSAAH